MPNFSLKRLMLSVTLIAIGLSLSIIPFKVATLLAFPISAGCWLVGGTMLGAGIYALFKKETEGAMVGAIIAIGWTFFMWVCGF
jgi:predicted membrane protein